MQTSIQISVTAEEEQKVLLQKRITQVKKRLTVLIDKLEELKIDLALIEEEYAHRVGRLYRKDNLLDLEILRYRKINELMDKGMSYEDAIMEVDKSSHDEDFGDLEEYMDIPETEEPTTEEENDIKKLWKKLVHKFHPDLAQSEVEKESRDIIMKKINIAYANKDYETLKNIQEKELVEDKADGTKERLEKLYVDMENAIVRSKTQLQELRSSEWFSWTKKSREEKERLFKDMEQKIAEDVMVKEVMLRSLKRKHGNL